ncbi:hypothetical protein APHAL10511_002326 [Amanita phalloides]|nr:hypothetical protein APHAL10511_002326 [Amanita phalloides]
MSQRQTSTVYSPSPLARSRIPDESDNNCRCDSRASTRSLYNYELDPTTSPDEITFNQDDDAKSASTVSPASTLSDVEIGHPLERVKRVGSANLLAGPLGDEGSWPPSLPGSQASLTNSTASDYVDFDGLMDSIRKLEICPYMIPDLYAIVSPSMEFNYKLMVRIIPKLSEELQLLNKLNHASHRGDPWNPTPYLLCSFDRDETDVYACFEHLTPYDKPPFCTASNYIDFFRQVLEGLAFLHEHAVVNLNCARHSSFKVDLSAGSSSTDFSASSGFASLNHPQPSHPTDSYSYPHSAHSSAHASPRLKTSPIPDPDGNLLFDRAKFPVKYYFVNFSDAFQHLSRHISSSAYTKDVQDMGVLFNDMIGSVPPLALKFKPLVTAMTAGGFTAEDSRKLFEALCKSLDASVFDVPVERLPSSATKAS